MRIVTVVWLIIGVLQAVGIGHGFIGVIYALSALCFFSGTQIEKCKCR